MDEWVPLRRICEQHGICESHTRRKAQSNPSLQVEMRRVEARKGQMRLMLCIPKGQVDSLLNMPCPGSGAHNQAEEVRCKKKRPRKVRVCETNYTGGDYAVFRSTGRVGKEL